VTLARELREEIGCKVQGEVRLMGFIRLHHLGPRRPEFRYPYPDNFHLIYFVRTENDPIARTEEPLVLAPRFVPISDAGTLALPPSERGFLAHPLLSA
jgi:8-oxo-dGTP pyrophosphatase MutT (NUDIX family)